MRIHVARAPEATRPSPPNVARKASSESGSSSRAVSRDANPIPACVDYRDEIDRAARHHGIDPLLLAAQAAQESGGPGAVSGRNVLQSNGHGHGLFQIDPAGGYGPWLEAHHDGLSVIENAEKAASIDAANLRRYGSTHAMLTAFNAGHDSDAASNVTTWPDGRRLHYAASVERHLAELASLVREGRR